MGGVITGDSCLVRQAATWNPILILRRQVGSRENCELLGSQDHWFSSLEAGSKAQIIDREEGSPA